MADLKSFWLTTLCVFTLLRPALRAESISIEGAPADTGYNTGSVAVIRATLRGVSGEVSRYAVFAEIQYVGTTAVTGVQMDRQAESKTGEVRYETGWPIPSDAPTGLYSVVVRVEDRSARKVVATQRLRGFAAYRKLVRIVRVRLDKTFYVPGEPIECEVALENLTERDLSDLRIEFSNANYPWISLFTTQGSSSTTQAENPELAVKVMRDHLNLAARSEATIPMMAAGTAAFLQGQQVAVLGAGGPARREKVPPPEVDTYTVAVWNADRTVLYDMQFTSPAIVRAADRERPTPYGRNFTHAYNSDIDFTKYREFYGPEQVSSAVSLDRSRTLFRPGDRVTVKAMLKDSEHVAWKGLELRAELADSAGKPVLAATLVSGIDLAPGQKHSVEAEAWTIPASQAPGVYPLRLSLVGADGRALGGITTDIAVNDLPKSLMVFNAHEDDEGAYGSLIRAAVEAGIPVRVVFFTSGDVGACERYYSKPCGPNEAREFGLVRMEESADALAHLGVARDKITFLGLPDGGSGAIWFEHVKASNPFLSIYLATDHAPYETVLKPNLPFAREPVVEQVKQLIADFRPAMIATTHPDERHVDHRTANWFALKACQELLRENRIDPHTIVLTDVAYGAGGFKPAPYRYIKAPVFLSGEAAAVKQEMGWLYQSQDGNLAEGMRQSLRELSRQEEHLRIMDWQEHEGWNE